MTAPRRYAADTSVSVEKSRGEIEKLLTKHGCDGFMYYADRGHAQVAFRMHERMIRFDLTLPSIADFAVGERRKRTPEAATRAWEQACRASWRALALVIKAKLEAVAAGITTFEIEFLPHVIVPGGKVFHEVALPQIAAAYASGKMPPLLGSGGSFAQASADRVALEPAAVTCEHCAAAMRSALLQLSVDVPRLPPEVCRG